MDNQPNERDCEICEYPFNTTTRCPRILKECGHTICEECAEKLWKQGKKQNVKCPFDRQVTKVMGTIKALPKNISLERLLIATQAEGVTAPQNLIGRCSKDPSHEAWFTCVDCEKDFCESCFDWKHCWSSVSHHKRIPTIDKSFQPPKCAKHPTSFADFVCQDADCEAEETIICNTCRLEEHRKHKIGNIREIVAENEKKLKEALIQKTTLETHRYLDGYIIKTRDSYAKEDERDFANALYNIRCYYDNKKCEAMTKLRKLAERKLVKANKLLVEHEDAMETNKKLEGIRSEIRGRLNSKRKLTDVEDIVNEHKKTYDELNKKRDTPIVKRMSALRFRFPAMELEIIDPDNSGIPDLSEDSSDDDHDQPGTSGTSC